VAVAGAASAQVTLSGKYAFGFVSDKVSDQAATTGLQTTDGHFTLTAVEDLGGGLKAIAKAEVLSRGRGTPISGRDASLTLAGGFGTVSMGSAESGNPVNNYFGSDGRGLDGNSWTSLAGGTYTGATLGGADVDFVKYTTPQVMPGLTF
jgi:predicted porin